MTSSFASRWLEPESRRRRIVLAAAVYAVCLLVFAAVAGPPRLTSHGAFNHYAHQADAWLHLRQDLRNGPPAYAMNNDFAEYDGKTYISFPPFPAVLMTPFVALAGSPEDFLDIQFLVWLAGVGPALLFLVLEKLRRTGRSPRTETENVALALLLAFGSVYFFSAVNGGVWFAAHVVGMAVMGAYVLCALDAERPWLAGLFMACAWTTRPTMLLTSVFFALEAVRVTARSPVEDDDRPLRERVRDLVARFDVEAFLRRAVPFAVPIVASFLLLSWMNYARFHRLSPFAMGHEYLGVVWRNRIEKWGLFHYHYLAKNLGVVLSVLPWTPPRGTFCFEGPQPASALRVVTSFFDCVPLRINEHGLALWFTTPFYLWLLKPRRATLLFAFLVATAALPATQDLLYQNSGWRQFGYRFSNDYAFLLFMALAVGGRPFGPLFRVAAAWAVVWNLLGAASFDRAAPWDRFYFREGSQQILYQAD